MRYCDLFKLNPIESVIKIAEADQLSEAQRLVSTFVVTPSLEDELTRVVIPMLDPTSRQEGKGLFVVGNYGTGKSHLMSFISVVAEHAEALDWLRDSQWADRLRPLAGKYLVKRHDLNVPDTDNVTLYQVIADQLNLLGAQHGVDYRMRDQGVTDIKAELGRWMDAVTAKYPDKYVLLVTDEVLDHLRRLKDHTRVRDLGMLRALGEFCDNSRLRFIAGVQQSLFENPEFQHVSDEIQRIRQRYADVRIDSRGVEQLISSYLFEKTDAQRQQIRAALEKQADLYPIIAQQMERFVQLFPAHPAFVDEFQRVIMVERREILKVLTAEGRAIADAALDDQPLPLITSDRYWAHIEADTGLNNNNTIAKCKQVAGTLRARIEKELDPSERPGALRLLPALCVNRLTIPDAGVAIGLTAEDLRDQLLWWADTPMRDASFLAQRIEVVLKKVREAANGQYLTVQGSQFYIDFSLDRDYDQEAATKAKQLAPDVVQRYLNSLLISALEFDNEKPVTEGRLWNTAIKWVDRQVERPGWLFFGYPNLRSTGKPPKDFYVFLCPSLRVQRIHEPITPQEDESYWFFEDFPLSARETGADAEKQAAWLDDLWLYAAHSELAELNKSESKETPFHRRAKNLRESLLNKFNSHCGEWVSVQLGDDRRPLREWMNELDSRLTASTFRTQFNCVHEWWFARWFETKYPEYPKFEVMQTESARDANARAAMEALSRIGMESQQAKAVLAALGLRINGVDTIDNSPWMAKLRERFRKLKNEQYLNAADLFKERDGRRWFTGECLEAEYLLVVLMAGVAAGEFVLYGKSNRHYDATKLEDLYRDIKIPDDVVRLGRPRDIPMEQWRKLFGVLRLKQSELAHQTNHPTAIRNFVEACNKRIEQISDLQSRFTVAWPMEQPEMAEVRQKGSVTLQAPSDILNKLINLNTPAKMRNLELGLDDIETLGQHLQRAEAYTQLIKSVEAWKPKLDAVARFQEILADVDTPIHQRANALREQLNALYRDPQRLDAEGKPVGELIDESVEAAVEAYRTRYKRARMDRQQTKRHEQLISCASWKQLQQLAKIDLFQQSQYDQLVNSLERLKPAKEFTMQDLINSPNGLLPGDPFDPRQAEHRIDAEEQLRQIETQIDALLNEWTNRLLHELRDEPIVKAGLEGLQPSERRGIDAFIESGRLPDPVDDAFIVAFNQLISGLKLKRLKGRELIDALFTDRSPMKLDELRTKLDAYLEQLAGAEDKKKIRVILED